MAPHKSTHPLAKKLFKQIIDTLQEQKIPDDFHKAIDIIQHTQGCVIVSGIGKSGYIAQKIHATFLSLGIRSSFLHAGEALHGDLGLMRPQDTLLLLSHSGKSHESLAVWNYAGELGLRRIAITSGTTSPLARSADALLHYSVEELCAWQRIPTLSTQMMHIYGDLLAIVLQHMLPITESQYLVHHPAGAHGIDAQKIAHYYDPIEKIPCVSPATSLINTLEHIQKYHKGYALIMDDTENLLGILTDGDVRRALLHDAQLSDPVTQWMTRSPITLTVDMNIDDVKKIFHKYKITAAPVHDDAQKLLGMLEHFHIGYLI